MQFHSATIGRVAAWALVIGLGSFIAYDAAGPVLEITPTRCDLGLLPVGREAIGEVVLHNTGWRTLTVSECRSTCGYSRLELSETRIAPGATAVIRATVYGNSSHRAGELSAILLKTNARQSREARIPILTEGMAGLRLLPDSLDFGSIPVESLPHQVRAKLIVNTGHQQHSMDRFQCHIDDARLMARLEPTENGEADLVVELKADCLPGDCWTHVTIKEREGNLSGTYPVHARVLGPHHSNPSTVMLDAGRPGDVSEGRLVAISRRQDGTSDTLSVTEVAIPPRLQAALQAQIISPHEVRLFATTNDQLLTFQSRIQCAIQIHVHDDQAGDSVISLPIVVTLRPNRDQQGGVP